MELQKCLLLRTHHLKRELEQLLQELNMAREEDGIHFRVANGLKNVDSIQVSDCQVKCQIVDLLALQS